MKPKKPIFVIACLCLVLLRVGAQEKYCKVKIYAPKDVVKRAELIGLLQIDHFMPDTDGGIISEISESDLQKLKGTSYKYKVLVADVAKQIDSLNTIYYKAIKNGQSRVAFEQPGSTINSIIKAPTAFEVKTTFGGYYSFSEMEAAMNTLVATYPAIASKTSIGKTAEGRDLWVIKISDNVSTDEANEPEVLYMGLQHAREAITGSSMVFFMQFLCENYASDLRIKNLVDNREIYIIPCFNPDGWEYNRTSQSGGAGGMWRKNRSKTDSTVTITPAKGNKSADTAVTYQLGVDLNRNWGVDWGNCGPPILGTASSCGSNNKSSDTYYGPTAFSELENQAVRKFTLEHHLVAGFDQHSYGPYYSLPFGRKSLNHVMPEKGKNFYTAVPSLMATYNGMRAADSYDALGYEVAGGFKDWMLMGEIGTGAKDTVWAMTGEGAAGGGTTSSFWAPASQIVYLSKGMCYQNLQLAYAAGTYVDIQDANDLALTSLIGDLNFKIKRIGLGNDPVTVSLIPLENMKTAGPSATVASMSYYEDYGGKISYSLAANLSNGQKVKFIWKVETSGYSYSDTIVKLYNPNVLLSDDMEGSFVANWTQTSDVADGWSFTSLVSFAGGKSMTESPSGNYSASTKRTVTYKNVLDLSDNTAAYLTFWTKYRAENFRDKLQVQVSTNSTDGVNGTWIPISGRTTIQEPGTLDGSTLNGQPALTGIRDYWTNEVFDLSSYKSSNVRFRFVFTSDSDPSSFKFEKDDGFYIDNLKVVKSTADLVTLPSHFLNVSATLMSDKIVQILWEANVDQQHDHFEIERSRDGFNYNYIGKVPGISPYQFTDLKPNIGYNYYRIKQADKNGSFRYSKTVYVYLKPDYQVNVYPNPVNDILFINIGFFQSDKFKIEMRDLQGRLLYSESKFHPSSSISSIDLRKWSPQVYVLRIENGRGEIIATQKVSKL